MSRRHSSSLFHGSHWTGTSQIGLAAIVFSLSMNGVATGVSGLYNNIYITFVVIQMPLI